MSILSMAYDTNFTFSFKRCVFKYKNRLCGDVCLQPSGEVNIVISKSFQNKHIGRRVINEIVQSAKEKDIQELHAEIYSFNTQSQKMFQSIGFKKVDDEQYILTL